MNTIKLLLIIAINIALVFAGDVYKCISDNTLIYGNNKGQNYVGAWLDTGDYIYATGVSNGYAKFYKGYVSLSGLQKQTSTKTNYKVTAKDGLYFNSGPGTNYNSLTLKDYGTAVVYYGRDWWENGWGVTNYGYCSMDYLATCPNSNCSGTGGGSSTGVYKCVKDKTYLYKDNKGQTKLNAWLDTGDYIYATAVSNGYAKFYKGYVSLSGLQKQTSTKTNYKVTAKDGVYFNSGPGTNYNSLTFKDYGTAVVYYGRDWWENGWGVTNYGYCSMDYLATCPNSNCSGTGGGSSTGVYKCVKDKTYLYKDNKGQTKLNAWLDTGDYIYATAVSNGYAKFYKGYVSLSGLQKQTSTKTNYKVTANDGLYFNSGPGTNYKSLTLKDYGTAVVYYGRDWWENGWGVTNYGYCSMDYLTCTNCGSSGGSTNNPTTREGKISTIYYYFINNVQGATKNGIAAILGCWDIESGIEPKCAEADYYNPPIGTGGNRNSPLYDDDNWLDMNGPQIYNGGNSGILKRGLGLGQWTDTYDYTYNTYSLRNSELRRYANLKGKKWYDLTLQLDFLLNGDNDYAISVVHDVLTSYDSVNNLTEEFLKKWEGVAGNKLSERQSSANQIYYYLVNNF